MREGYNYVKESQAYGMLYPHKTRENFHCCEGELCMGWVKELNDQGEPTRRGRCGKVSGLIYICNCGV